MVLERLTGYIKNKIITIIINIMFHKIRIKKQKKTVLPYQMNGLKFNTLQGSTCYKANGLTEYHR